MKGSRLGAILLGCAAMAQHGVVLLLMGPVLPDLMREFGVRESLAGLLLSAGSFGFTVGPLFAGRLIDRRGVRVAMLVGLVIELAVLAAFGAVPAFAAAVALGFLLPYEIPDLGDQSIEARHNLSPPGPAGPRPVLR